MLDDARAFVDLPTWNALHARMQLPVDKAWTAPSVVGRRVYVRTNTALFALELP